METKQQEGVRSTDRHPNRVITKIDTLFMVGVKIRVPYDRGVGSMMPTDRDKWGVEQVRVNGFKPLEITVVQKVYEGTIEPIGLSIMTYNYKRRSNGRLAN